MAAYLSPVFGAGTQLFDNQGAILSGGLVYTYQAGTTTALGTWTDSTQAVANANPIVLDSTGRFSQQIWLTQGYTYKFVVRDSSGNLIGTFDNIAGINDVSAPSISEWVATGLTPSYISSTSFSVAGNNTASFQPNRRVKIAVTGGTVYGYVVSSTFATSITTVVIGVDSIGLDAGISSVSIALLDSVNVSTPQQFLIMSPTVSVASATTTPIGAAASVNVEVTGTTTITAFDTVTAGVFRLVKFSNVLTLTYNATSLILPGATDYTTTAGDTAIFRSLGSGNWECISFTAASNTPNVFAAGTRIGFQQTAVPTGWTKDTTAAMNDSAMRIVTGTASSGGTLGFSTASTGAYTLQIADIPAHTHSSTTYNTFQLAGGSQGNQPVAGDTGSTGGGGSHSHALALKYYDFSIGVKN